MRIRCMIIAMALAGISMFSADAMAREGRRYTSTDSDFWKESRVRLQKAADERPLLEIRTDSDGIPLRAWGTTFNELDWDAFNILDRSRQEKIMELLFSPGGDLRFTRGRIPMNASDYGRTWYSCDDVAGDLELRHFNIDRDKTGIIPLIRAAQKYNPDLGFWCSPWSPPAWMKINNHYSVVSNPEVNDADPRVDYLLYGSATDSIDADEMMFLGYRASQFPRQMATQDYIIQDPRYLKAYANYFCKFIDAFAEQGIPIDMVMYQNEGYSYTKYPGCAWTADGTIRFNRDYLAPALKEHHPDVRLYLGTINSNRQDHVDRVLAGEGLLDCIEGIGLQWQGRGLLAHLRADHPDLHFICSESECGHGEMDWKSAERTFFVISDNIGKGADEWYNWNFILPDSGASTWGWRQNALIQVDSKTRDYRLTPEYFAVKHFSNIIAPGSKIVGYTPPRKNSNVMATAYITPDNQVVIVAGNFEDERRRTTFKIDGSYLNVELPAHSFSTFVIG